MKFLVVLFSVICTALSECSVIEKVYYHDCEEALSSGQLYSGVYSIKPDHLPPFNVYCDMDTDGGGWMVIQRRMDGSEDFDRKWIDYVVGFGDLNGEFWLGLSKIHRLTESSAKDGANTTLRVDYQQFGGRIDTATYHAFRVLGASTSYQLSFAEISGNMSDSLTDDHNDMMFSTDDVDNDFDPTKKCATQFQGGWWYKSCLPSQFNEPYPQVYQMSKDDKKDHFSFEFSEMKLRHEETQAVYTDCKRALEHGQTSSGIFTVNPDNQEPFNVYCDMETDGGGWTVFQRRQDGSEDFYRGWTDYETGFGDLNGEFWLGLDKIHRVTGTGQSNTLRIDLGDFEGNQRYAKYTSFGVSDSSTNYRLTVAGYGGDATDSLARHNGMMFSTKDHDNDVYSSSCAQRYKGGWWYDQCHTSNLNGLYASTTYGQGINWRTWKGYHYSLKFTEMKLRKEDA